MSLLTKEAERMQVIKRLQKTPPHETVGVWGWEIKILLDYIDELKRGAKHGNAEVRKADCTGKVDRFGDW